MDEHEECPDDMIMISDWINPNKNSVYGSRIPRIIHQTSKSRYMTPKLAKLTRSWRIPGYEYRFYDDAAVNSLFEEKWPIFPHLKTVINCFSQGTLRADLWRYLILYEYGGIYADIDTSPNTFNGSQISHRTDAFFVVEQYHLLSQYFMAVSPRHPLMYYAIQHALLNLMQVKDILGVNAAFVTGPHALHRGFQSFMQDVGVEIPDMRKGAKPVKQGVYLGTGNRSLTVVGEAENQNNLVIREAIGRNQKVKEYARMGMTHFLDERKGSSGISCIQAIYENQKKDGIL